MPNPTIMRLPKPLSLMHLRRLFAGSDPDKAALFAGLLPWDYFYEAHDFSGTLDSVKWSTAVTVGGAPTAFAYNAQRNGAVRGATGATDNGVTKLYYANVIFDAADNPVMLIRWKAPAAVTGFSFEIGFSDEATDEALPGVTDVDTPATGNGVTDIVCVHMDTDQTLTTAALVGDGTTPAAAKTNIGTWTPTVDGWIEMMIAVRAGLGFASIWDSGAQQGGLIYSVGSGPDAAVLMRPYALFRTRNTVTKQIDIDHIILVAERNATT